MKRFAVVFLAALMVFMVMAQSGLAEVAVSKTEYPIVDEEITLKLVTVHGSGEGAFSDKWIYQKMTEISGMNLESTDIMDTAWAERKSLMFATDDLPDVLFGASLSDSETLQYVDSGQLRMMDDLIEAGYAPNMSKMFEERPYIQQEVTLPDGHIYTAPSAEYLEYTMLGDVRYWINTTWLENLNLSMPTTLDEFYDTLVAFQTQDPNGNGEADEIAVGGYLNRSIKGFVMAALGYVDTDQIRGVAPDGKTVVCPILTEEFKEYLRFMNKLNEQGLLDPEWFTQTYESYAAKGAQQRYGFAQMDANYLIAGERYQDYTIPMPLISEMNDVQQAAISTGVSRGKAAITIACAYPEAAMRLIDYCLSEEGTLTVLCGSDQPIYNGNPTWKYSEDGQNVEYVVPDEYDSFWAFMINEIGQYQLPFQTFTWWGMLAKEEVEIDFSEKMTALVPYARRVFPNVYLTAEDQELVTRYSTDIKTYADQMEAKFITGELSIESDWDAYVATIQSMHIDEIVALYQNAYDVYYEE